MIVFHIVKVLIWEAAKATGEYRPASLESEGFIHFSKVEQVVATANRFYRGQDGLVLLEVSCDRLNPFVTMPFLDTAAFLIYTFLYLSAQ